MTLQEVKWNPLPSDVALAAALVADALNEPAVALRRKENLSESKNDATREQVWVKIVACLLTSQQRMGPDTAVDRLLCADPFPLRYDECVEAASVEVFACSRLEHRGLRFHRRIARFLRQNLAVLEGGLWAGFLERVNSVNSRSAPAHERSVADFIDDALAGFGPKQARNLLQWLGRSRYEVPIDSRVARWLARTSCPQELLRLALRNRWHYHALMDSILELCSQVNVYPCVLDAAIFERFPLTRRGGIDQARSG